MLQEQPEQATGRQQARELTGYMGIESVSKTAV